MDEDEDPTSEKNKRIYRRNGHLIFVAFIIVCQIGSIFSPYEGEGQIVVLGCLAILFLSLKTDY